MVVNQLDTAEFRRRTVVSGLVVFGVRTIQSVLSLGAAIVLARLLTPEDFGVFAMVMPLGVIATGLAGHCFQTALLQRRELSDQDASAFYWYAARINLLVSACMVAVGFALSRFYGEPRIVGVTVMWAVLIYLLTLTCFQEALLKREMRFARILFLQLATLVLGITASVIAARRGAGHWSLPLQILVMEVARAIGVFFLSAWRPRWKVDSNGPQVAEMRRLWRGLAGLRLATWVNEQPDLVAVGRFGGAAVLGLYDTARRWSWYPFEQPFFALTEVAVASLSRVLGETARFNRLASRAILVMLTVSMPAIAFVAVETVSVVQVLLGERWLPSVPFIRPLCVVAFAGAVAHVSEWIYLSHGNTGRLLKWSLFIKTPTIVLAVLVGVRWGALGVAMAMAVASTLLMLPAVAYGVRGTSLSFGDVIRAGARPALSSLFAAAGTVLLDAVLPTDAGARRLVASLGVYVVAFVVAWFAMPGGATVTRSLASSFREFRPPVQR